MSQNCKHGWKGDCPMCAFEASQTTPTVMSDTKQQCPTCGSADRNKQLCLSRDPQHRHNYHSYPRGPEADCPNCGEFIELLDSPSAAGSGAREWLTRNCVNCESWFETLGADNAEAIIARMETYADHCTVQLREQLTDVDALFTKHMKGLLDAIGMYGVPDSPDTKVQTLDDDGIEELRLCVVGKIEEL